MVFKMIRMIKLLKIVSILLIFSFSLLVSFPLFSQSNPIVQVDPVVNLSDEAWLDAVCDAATDNVIFTLKFLGKFEVKSDSTTENETDKLKNVEAIDQKTFDTSSLKTRAESKGYDNILFGSCTIENGSYVITMNAYDLVLDKITYSGSTEVESVFDTFEAVDEITYQTVEGFSGIHVTYGSLVLGPPDTGEPFSFTIDGIALPEGTFAVERMPVGAHELAVSQERPLGLYEAVHEIEVVGEIENIFDIPLPDIIGEELVVFNQADKYLTLTSLGKEPGLALAMNNLYSLLDTPFFKKYRSELIKKYETWVSMMDGEIEILDKTGSKLSLSIWSPWQSEINKDVYNENVSLSKQYELLFLNDEQLNLKNIFVPDFKTIKIDGKADDWGDVSTVFKDKIGDFLKTNKFGGEQDIDWVGIAMDNERIYFALKTVSEIYRKECMYHMNYKIENYLSFHYFGPSNIFETAKIKPNSDWSKALWYNSKDSSIEGKIGDIIEVSFSLNQMSKWVKPYGNEIELYFNTQIASESHSVIDSVVINTILPSVFSAFRSIEL